MPLIYLDKETIDKLKAFATAHNREGMLPSHGKMTWRSALDGILEDALCPNNVCFDEALDYYQKAIKRIEKKYDKNL